MAKQYLTNAINSSPTRAYPAAAAMQSVGGYAVKLNSNEKIVLCDTAGEMPLGIVTIDNDHIIAAGDSVSVQLKDIGKAQIGENVSALDELAVNASGKLVKASAGDYVAAIALGDYKSGTMGSVKIARYIKTASGAAEGADLSGLSLAVKTGTQLQSDVEGETLTADANYACLYNGDALISYAALPA